jgi:predicted small lipoprotein YifL
MKTRQSKSKAQWIRLLAFSSLVFAGAGCGSKQPLAQPPVAETAPEAGTATVPEPQVVRPVAVPEPSGGDTAPVLNALTQALRKYAFEHHGMPRTFAEVVSAGYVSNLPDPPAGKKYEIDPRATRVVIVKQ